MKKFAFVLLAVCLYAAEPWQSKPFADWSDKDVQKVLNNSPWSRTANVPAPQAMTTGGGIDPTGSTRNANPMTNNGGRTGALGGGLGPTDPGFDLSRTIPLIVRWQSALPIKHALARVNYKAGDTTPPDVQKFLEEGSAYVIDVTGIPPTADMNNLNQMKAAILSVTNLSAKSKSLRPFDMIVAPANAGVYFVFRKTTPFDADDKEVDFTTKLGSMEIKSRFRLKDMQYEGKLEL